MASAPLTHNQIWTALDRLAARAKLSPSGLAKRSGLDPTTFNKSKRITPDGRARWPSTESVAKALSATSVSIESFVSLIGESNGAAPAAPVRRGDRVVVKTGNGEIMLKELKRQTAKQVELKSLNADQPERTVA